MFLEQFLKYLKFQKRYSQHTITAYNNDITQFSTFLTSLSQNYSTANHQSVRDWVVNLMDDGLEAKSVNRKISSLRSFYKYLLKEDIIIKNPVAKVQTPKVAKKLPSFVSDDKLSLLLDNSVFTNEFESIRDKLILELLFGTGIRLNELLQLRLGDIQLAEKTLKVLGKRNKERIIPIHSTLINSLNNYITLRNEKQFINSSDSLIITNNGNAAYAKFIYRVVHQYLSLITTQDKKSPHVLRHTFATSLLNKGADINAIKDLLGHANLAATQIYTHNSIERLKSIYKQAHPKA
jgi:integrase/recombinase XerC